MKKTIGPPKKTYVDAGEQLVAEFYVRHFALRFATPISGQGRI